MYRRGPLTLAVVFVMIRHVGGDSQTCNGNDGTTCKAEVTVGQTVRVTYTQVTIVGGNWNSASVIPLSSCLSSGVCAPTPRTENGVTYSFTADASTGEFHMDMTGFTTASEAVYTWTSTGSTSSLDFRLNYTITPTLSLDESVGGKITATTTCAYPSDDYVNSLKWSRVFADDNVEEAFTQTSVPTSATALCTEGKEITNVLSYTNEGERKFKFKIDIGNGVTALSSKDYFMKGPTTTSTTSVSTSTTAAPTTTAVPTTTTTTAVSTTTTTTAQTTVTTAQTLAATASPTKKDNQDEILIIILPVIGGIIVIGVLAIALLWWYRRHRGRKPSESSGETYDKEKVRYGDRDRNYQHRDGDRDRNYQHRDGDRDRNSQHHQWRHPQYYPSPEYGRQYNYYTSTPGRDQGYVTYNGRNFTRNPIHEQPYYIAEPRDVYNSSQLRMNQKQYEYSRPKQTSRPATQSVPYMQYRRDYQGGKSYRA